MSSHLPSGDKDVEQTQYTSAVVHAYVLLSNYTGSYNNCSGKGRLIECTDVLQYFHPYNTKLILTTLNVSN